MTYNDNRVKASFKERLKTAMTIRKKTSTDVCNATGIAKSTFSQWLSGRNEAKADRVHAIAKYLNVNEAWLIGYDVPMDRTPMQKKNDDIVEVIAKLREDEDFYDLVGILAKLSPKQYDSIKQLLIAFTDK